MLTVADLQQLVNEKQAPELLQLRLVVRAVDPLEPEALKFIARFLSPQVYNDIIEERCVLARCGYPTCANELRTATGGLRKPLGATVLPWQRHFCARQCFQSSEFYKHQLSKEPLELRKGTPPEVLLLPEVCALAKAKNVSVAEMVYELVKQQKADAALSEGLERLELTE